MTGVQTQSAADGQEAIRHVENWTVPEILEYGAFFLKTVGSVQKKKKEKS